MKKLQYSESQLQHAVLERLAWYKRDPIYYMRNNSVAGKLIRPDGSTGWVNNAKKGAPDIILLKNGFWIGIELKSKNGNQSIEQKQAAKDIRSAGGHYFVVRTLEEIDAILDTF